MRNFLIGHQLIWIWTYVGSTYEEGMLSKYWQMSGNIFAFSRSYSYPTCPILISYMIPSCLTSCTNKLALISLHSHSVLWEFHFSRNTLTCLKLIFSAACIWKPFHFLLIWYVLFEKNLVLSLVEYNTLSNANWNSLHAAENNQVFCPIMKCFFFFYCMPFSIETKTSQLWSSSK